VVTVRQLVEDSLGQSRFTSRLLGAFASLALVLAAVGIFGVLAYTTSRRVREIGIRFALGAQRSQVLLQVIRRGLLVAGFGVVLGILGAMAATRMLQSLLFGVSSWDPMTFILTAVLLLGVAVLASLLPAYRASRVHPAMVLRGE
jgi:ABC-type antimicrobial peptide transport system permease subunit